MISAEIRPYCYPSAICSLGIDCDKFADGLGDSLQLLPDVDGG